MQAHALAKRIDRLLASNRPRIIDCSGAKDELLARLAAQIEDDPAGQEPVDDGTADQLTTLIERDIARIERAYHLRFSA